MATSDNSRPPCPKCRDEFDECRQRLRGVRRELHRTQSWLESKATRLDRLIGDLDLYLDGHLGSKSAREAARAADAALTALKVRPRSDGNFDVYLEHKGPFRFPPMLTRLLQLLAEDKGRDMEDGLVGFKSKTHLVTALAQSTDINNGKGGLGRPGTLRQAISALRARLGRVATSGESLIQTRRNIGFRLAVRTPDRR